MRKLPPSVVRADTFSVFKYVSVLIVYGIIILLNCKIFKLDWSDFLLHPIQNMEGFLFAVLGSLAISWKIHDLRKENEAIVERYRISIQMIYDYSRDQFQQSVKELESTNDEAKINTSFAKEINDHVEKMQKRAQELNSFDQKEWSYNGIISSYLFFTNLLLAGYITLCVSNALIEKSGIEPVIFIL